MKKNFKKLVSVLICIIMCLQLFPVITYAEETSIQEAIVEIGCSQITDAVQIADSADLLIVDGPYKTLYKASFLTGDVKSVELEYTPNSVDYFGDKIYVGCGNENTILVYTMETLELIETIAVLEFYDMALGIDGEIYTTTSARLEKHPYYNSFYYTSRGVSPADVHVIKYENGQIKSSYDSRYHGHYVEGAINRITPDGEFLINSSGNIVRISEEKENDIIFYFNMGQSYTDLCFDAEADRFFAVISNTITQYKTSTYERLSSYTTEKTVDRVFAYDGYVAALQKNKIGLYYAEVLNAEAMDIAQEPIPVTETLVKTGDILNLEMKSVVDSILIEDTKEMVMLTPSYVYKIDLVNNVQTKVRFPYNATKLSIGDDMIFVGSGRQGVVCVYDLNTLEYIKTIFTEELFLGMEVGNDGYLYTGENDSWHATACSFDVQTGEKLASYKNTYHMANYEKVADINAFYYYNEGDFCRRTYDEGKIGAVKTFGNSASGNIIAVSQDGKYVFLHNGNILEVSGTSLRNLPKLDITAVDACFDEESNRVYAALSEKLVYEFDNITFEGRCVYGTRGYAKKIFDVDNNLILLSTTTQSTSSAKCEYFIETINLDDPQSIIETTITSKALTYENGQALLGVTTKSDVAFNEDIIYVADQEQKAVYVVDPTAMTETKIEFLTAPTSVHYDNDELFVGFGDDKIVVILDAKTFSVKDTIYTRKAFFDMAVGKDGYIYVNDSKDIVSYLRATGQQYSSIDNYPHYGYMEVSPVGNSIYFTTIGISPADIDTIKYNNGELVAAYDSSYHGSHSIGRNVRLSPDGRNAFTSGGSIFICNDVKEADMYFRCKFTPFTDLSFDIANNQMFSGQTGKHVYVYDYTTLEKIGFIRTVYPVVNLTNYEGKIIAVSSNEDAFYLEVLNSSDVLEVLPEKLVCDDGDTLILTKDYSQKLDTHILHNDESTIPVDNAVYTSSNENVAVVNETGLVTGVESGHAVITIESQGLTTTVDVFVDVFADSIEVEGYDIGFYPERTYYTVKLAEKTTKLPTIKATAADIYDVKITYPEVVPGYAKVTVGIGDKVAIYYEIRFNGVLTPEVINPYPSVSGSASVSAAGGKGNIKVSYETNGGSVIDDVKVEKGGKLTAPPVPVKEGYIFDGWYTDADLTKEYDFDKAASKNVTLYAKWTKAEETVWTNPFADVNADDWFYKDVEYALKNKLFQGTAEDMFSPELPMTRAMLVTVIYRMAGSPAVEAEGTFGDVAGDAYYYDAVAWAAEKGVVTGVGDNLFAPDAFVTREQIAVILQRYLKYAGIELSTMQSYAGFADEGDISDYAKDAVKLMNELGIINGKDDSGTTKFAPTDNGTRAELAAMLHRLSNLMQNN